MLPAPDRPPGLHAAGGLLGCSTKVPRRESPGQRWDKWESSDDRSLVFDTCSPHRGGVSRSPGDRCGAGHAPAQPAPPTRTALEARPCRTTARLTPNREAKTCRPLRSTGRSAGGCGRTPRDLCSLDWRPWAGPPGRGPRMTVPGSPLSRGAPEACVAFADSFGAGAPFPDGHPTHSPVGLVHVLSTSRTALARWANLCYDRLSSCGGHVSRRRTGFCAQMRGPRRCARWDGTPESPPLRSTAVAAVASPPAVCAAAAVPGGAGTACRHYRARNIV